MPDTSRLISDGAAADVRSLSDDALLRRLLDLLSRSRRNEAELIAHIGEVDRRRLYARAAAPSMFEYCTDVLHLSEHEAYLRITVARTAPVVTSTELLSGFGFGGVAGKSRSR